MKGDRRFSNRSPPSSPLMRLHVQKERLYLLRQIIPKECWISYFPEIQQGKENICTASISTTVGQRLPQAFDDYILALAVYISWSSAAWIRAIPNEGVVEQVSRDMDASCSVSPFSRLGFWTILDGQNKKETCIQGWKIMDESNPRRFSSAKRKDGKVSDGACCNCLERLCVVVTTFLSCFSAWKIYILSTVFFVW